MRRLGIAAVVLAAALVGLGAGARAGTADEPIDPDGSNASADAQTEPRLPTVQLVQAWPKTKQALLYDPIQGTYIVVGAGQNVDGFRVTRIGKNQIVLSSIGGEARDYVLLPTPVADLPDASGASGASGEPRPAAGAAITAAPPKPRPDLLDPYPAGVLDPYGSEGMHVVEAPPGSAATPAPPTGPVTPAPVTVGPAIAKPAAPSVPAVPGPAIAKPAPTTPTPAAAQKPPAAPAKPPAPGPAIAKPAPATPAVVSAAPPAAVVLDKKELNDALSDFGTLTKDSRLTLGPTGVAFAKVAPGSLFARIGLRDGDRVVTINGAPIASLDDAASLYAQLGGMKQLSLDVVRGAGHVTLHADLH